VPAGFGTEEGLTNLERSIGGMELEGGVRIDNNLRDGFGWDGMVNFFDRDLGASIFWC